MVVMANKLVWVRKLMVMVIVHKKEEYCLLCL